MKIYILDIETGEILGETSSRYNNVIAVFENARKWCKRHGYESAGEVSMRDGKLKGVYVRKA